MNFDLSEEQSLFIQTARDFAAEQLAPHAAEWDEKAIFPKDTLRAAADLGLMAIYAPEDAGGLGLSRLDAALIFEALSEGCTSTTAYMTIHNMVTWMVGTWGTDTAKERFAASLVSAESLGSYCLTEPGAGSDAAQLSTKAVKVDGGYEITGTKVFISGGGDTDVLVAMARTGGEGAKGVSAFVLDAHSMGISFGKKEPKMGWNSQPTRQVNFDSVFVPDDGLLATEGEGFTLAMKALDGGRLNIASCSLGTAKAALEQARLYTADRKQFNKPISAFQNTQFAFADQMTAWVAAHQTLCYAAWALDTGSSDARALCAMAKRLGTDTGFQIVDQCLQMHGGYGYIKEYPVERMLRDLRVHRILEGTNEIMRLVIARTALEKSNWLSP